MLQNVPGWVQAGIAVLLLIGMVVAFGVHIQAGVAHNNQAIIGVEEKVDDVDSIVRDNQQRLAHLEALLEYQLLTSQQPQPTAPVDTDTQYSMEVLNHGQ